MTGATQPPVFSNSKQKSAFIHSRVWRNCASPCVSPQLGCSSEACYDNLLEPLFLISQQPPAHWVPVLPVLSSSPRWMRFCVFQYIDQNLYDCHNLLQSSVSTEGAMEWHTWNLCAKANQGHRKASTITSVFPSPLGTSFFWRGLTGVPGCRGKAGFQCCSFAWASVL